MSRRVGGRKPVNKKQHPLVSEHWNTLIATTMSMLETLGGEDDEAFESCNEQVAILSEFKKKRMSFQEKMGVIDAITQTIQDYMLGLLYLDAEKQEENNVAELFDNFFTSTLAILDESIEATGGYGVHSENDTQSENEQLVAITLRLLDMLVGATVQNPENAKKYFVPHMPAIFDLSLKLGLDKARSYFVREVALVTIGNLVESHAINSILIETDNGALINQLVDTCFQLCADEDDEALDPTTPSSQNLGTQLLDTIAGHLTDDTKSPPLHVAAPLILAKSLKTLKDEKDTSSKYAKKAALVTLAVLPEACNVFSKDSANLSNIMSLLNDYMNVPTDANTALFKSAAFICLAEYLEHLQPEISPYHSDLLPRLIAIVGSDSSSESMLVKTKACIPLIQLCLHLPEDYLEDESQADKDKNMVFWIIALIKKIRTKSTDSLSKEDFDLIESLVMCIRSIASAQESNYEPYVAVSLELLYNIIETSTVELSLGTRGNATTALGEVIVAAGKVAILPHLERINQLLLANMKLEPEKVNYMVRAATHATWAQLANLLMLDFTPYLAEIVPFICRSLALDYGENENEEENEDEEEDDEAMQQGDDSEDVLEERKFALICYKACVDAVGPAFLPYQDRCFEVVHDNAREYSEEIQSHVSQLIASFTALYPLGEATWQAGSAVGLPEKATKLFEDAKSVLFNYIQFGTDPYVVEESLDALAKLLKTYGIAAIGNDDKSIKFIEKQALKLLKGAAICQNEDAGMDQFFGEDEFEDEDDEDGEEEEEDEEEEEEEHEHEHGPGCADGGCHSHDEDDDTTSLDASTLDVLGSLARAQGVKFEPVFNKLWKTLVRTMKSESYRGYTFGFLAEVLEALGNDKFESYALQMFPILMTQLQKPIKQINTSRNYAYAIGQFYLKYGSNPTFQPFVQPSLDGLQAILTHINDSLSGPMDKEEYDDFLGCRDNVVSALGKLIMTNAASIPLDKVVPQFIGGLPLKSDLEEANYVYSTCIKMVNNFPKEHAGIIEPFFPTLLQVFASVLSNSEISDKLKTFVTSGVSAILAAQPDLRATWDEQALANSLENLNIA